MLSRNLKALLAALLACACLPSFTAAAQEQNEGPRVVRRITVGDEPVDELELEVGGRPVKLNRIFTAKRDWLKGLKMKARNVSGRYIVYAEVMLDVPKSGTMELPLVISLRYGEMPPLEPVANPKHKPVPPGETFKLTIPDLLVDNIMRYLAERGVTQVIDVSMIKLMVIYDDDTGWNEGRRMRRDRSHPYKWLSVKPSGTSRPRRTIQKAGWKLPHMAYGARAAADDVPVQCHTHFDVVALPCNTETDSDVCTANSETPRLKKFDDFPEQKQLLGSGGAAHCFFRSRTVGVAVQSSLCGYSGGNQEQ